MAFSHALTHARVHSPVPSAGLSAGMDQEGGGGPTYPPVQTGIPAAAMAAAA